MILCALVLTLGASAQSPKAIVAYFSATGTTESAAKKLAKANKAELYAIVPAKEYSSADLDWTNKKSRSTLEMNDTKARPALKDQKDLSMYDVIYLGYPIWWGVAPRIINTFIEQANMKGKAVIPFATSGGSTIEKSVKELKAAYPEIQWQAGNLM